MYKKKNCPGGKIRSKGMGKGLGRGMGMGPVGVPSGNRQRLDGMNMKQSIAGIVPTSGNMSSIFRIHLPPTLRRSPFLQSWSLVYQPQ